MSAIVGPAPVVAGAALAGRDHAGRQGRSGERTDAVTGVSTSGLAWQHRQRLRLGRSLPRRAAATLTVGIGAAVRQ